MPTYEVTAPDGQVFEVTAPDGASEAQVMAYAKSQFGKQKAQAPAAPKGPPPRALNRAETLLGAIYQPVTNLAARAATGVNETLGTNFQGDIRLDQQNDADLAASPYQGAKLAGNVVGTLPTLAIPGGPVVQGMAGGLALSEADDAAGVAIDTIGGGIASGVGWGVVGGVQRAIAPKLSAGVAALTKEGIRLTPGQAARATGTRIGEAVGAAEDKFMSLPFAGDIIEAGRKTANEDFNRALLSRPLKAIGQAFPKGAPIGHEGIKAVGDVLSNGYKATLKAASGNVDKAFDKAIDGITRKANLPAAERKQLAEILQREVRDALGSRFTGQRIGNVQERLSKLASDFGKVEGNPYARGIGEALENSRAAVLAMVRRQNPKIAKQLADLDRGWAELVRVERAALNTADGVITPQGYKQAIRIADGSVRKRAVARGTAMGQDFSTAASQALPSKVPNSKSFDRFAANSLYTVAGAALAPVAAGARMATPLVTRNAGPGAQRASNALIPLRRGAAVAGPALLLRPEE